MYNNQHNNHYEYSAPPQQHGYGHQDTYAMNDMTQQNPYPYYDEPKPATNDGYRTSQIATEKYARRNNQSRSCCDKICCGCCTCCPRWCRWLSCILLLIIIALGIVIGVLAALFKMPTVTFEGVQGTPAFGLEGMNVNLNLTLGFQVTNPNIESVTFKTLTATAYYHGDTTSLGGGTLNDLHIGDHSVNNINFPFQISMDITNTDTFNVTNQILTDCSSNAKIPLDYKIVATVSIIGIPISIPISNSISIDCPLDSSGSSSMIQQIEGVIASLIGGGSGDSAAGSLGGAIASVLADNGGAVPTSIPSGVTVPSGVSIPAGVPTDLAGLAGLAGGSSR